MGKAAQNETIKLRATRYNNLSVGLYLGGCLIPYLSFTQRAGDLAVQVAQYFRGDVTPSALSVQTAIATVLAFMLAFWAAHHFRRLSLTEIAKIED